MKGIFFLIVFGLGLMTLSGCYTVPRHIVNEEEVVYYPPVDPPIFTRSNIIIVDPPPPSPPVYYPPSTGTNPQRDRLPEKPKDSYRERDPLQGGNHRGSGEINTVPPVRTPERKDKGRQ
ncbi:MAG: hypothetical protein U5J96_03015 [Ignavibacteriaceae bacterium]|nr:hypothetical protein [Ignavibacteriaceae bacterium]